MESDDHSQQVHAILRAGRWTFTAHAEARCRQRGIEIADVAALLASQPCRDDRFQPGTLLAWGRIHGRRVRVVFRVRNDPPGEVVVITVMHEDDHD